MPASALLDKLSYFANGHQVLSRDEQRQAHLHAEAVSQCLETRCRTIVAESGDRALMFWYSSDGTPVLSRKTSVDALGALKVIKRAGCCEEHLVERAMVKTTNALDQPVACVLMKPPRPLSEGKSAWHAFSAAIDFSPIVRQIKPEGIIVNCY